MEGHRRSFFSRWKNRFIESGMLGVNPEGRYLALCLAEALRESQTLRQRLLGVSDTDAVQDVTLESHFPGSKKNRYSDIGLVGVDGRTSCLIEIKVEDHLQDGQLMDYLSFCKRERCQFLLISKYPIEIAETKQIEASGIGSHILIASIVEILRSINAAAHPICGLLLDYLKEQNMVYVPSIDADAVNAFMTRLLWPNRGSGGRLQKNDRMIEDIPVALHRIMSNLRVAGSYLFPDLRFQFDFQVSSFAHLSGRALKQMRSIADGEEPGQDDDGANFEATTGKSPAFEIYLNQRSTNMVRRNGGRVYFFGQSKIRGGRPWPYLCFGYCAIKDRAGNAAATLHPYLELWTDTNSICLEENLTLRWNARLEIYLKKMNKLMETADSRLDDESDLRRHFRSLLRKRVESSAA